MRGVLLAPLCALLASCGLISGLDDLKVCANCGDGAEPDAADASIDASNDVNGDSSLDTVAPWSVSSVQGLALWLDATNSPIKTVNNSNQVLGWNDLSPNHNNAQQTNASVAPTLTTFGATSVFGAIHFSSNPQGSQLGNELVIADSTSLQWGNNDFYIAVVASFDNNIADGLAAGVGTFYAKGDAISSLAVGLAGNRGGWSGSYLSTGFQASAGNINTGAPGTDNDGVARLYACQRSGSVLSLRLNGAGVASGTLPVQGVDVSAAGVAASIGAVGDATDDRLDGNIAEIIAVNSPAAADVSKIEAYLMKKYGIP